MPRILVIVGESQGCQAALAALALIEASALPVPDMAAALEALSQHTLEAAAIDLALCAPTDPALGEFLTACKGASPAVPVLALVPGNALADFQAAEQFEDFVAVPYRTTEVAARVRSLIRRYQPANEASHLRVGELVIDLGRYEVSQAGKRMELTFKEYELLKFLAMNPGKVFTREVLLNRVWGYDYYGGTRTVDVHIRRLRSKIENGPEVYIDTVRNVGYRFHEPRA